MEAGKANSFISFVTCRWPRF